MVQEQRPVVSSAPEPSSSVVSTPAAHAGDLRSNEARARDYVMRIYGLVEEGKTNEALLKLREHRVFIAQNVSPTVFNMLELTVAQSASSQGGAAQPVQGYSSREDQYIERIKGYIRQNKAEAAYAHFKQVRRHLKKYMDKPEFEALEDMVKNAHRYSHGRR
jgi:hypothetical protein